MAKDLEGNYKIMTDDDVIQFAAGKAGEEIEKVLFKHQGPLHDQDYWQWCYVSLGQEFAKFSLDSWELFGKGLAVCLHRVTILKHASVESSTDWLQIHHCDTDSTITERFIEPSDLPKAFWRCWYRLEHDEP